MDRRSSIGEGRVCEGSETEVLGVGNDDGIGKILAGHRSIVGLQGSCFEKFGLLQMRSIVPLGFEHGLL